MLFKIGEQYEKQEFYLQRINTLLLGDLEYEVYRHLSEMRIELLGVLIKSVMLYYNADILSAVQYHLVEEICADELLLKEKIQEVNNVEITLDKTNLWIMSKTFSLNKI